MSELKHESCGRMLLQFFNITMGSRARFSDYAEQIDSIINDDESNIRDIKQAIKTEKAAGGCYIDKFIENYKVQKFSKKVEPEQPAPAPAPAPATPFDASLQLVTATIAQMVSTIKGDEIKANISESLRADIDKYIADTYGHIERKVNLISEFGKHEVKGIQHKVFNKVLSYVANDEPVYLAGPAGSGKNILCKQIADALGLEFYFANAVTQEYKLTGFTDANGTFHESQFYKAFKDGGLFMLDEMDASIPEVLIILNAAIANRYFDFPAPIGKVQAHKDFRVIAAGNTLGHGADSEYTARNTLDAASLDRFLLVQVDYDKRIELAITNNDTALVEFCETYRNACQKAGLQVVVSYRAISRIAKMKAILPLQEVLADGLIKGLDKDDLNTIKSSLTAHGDYYKAIESIIASMN